MKTKKLKKPAIKVSRKAPYGIRLSESTKKLLKKKAKGEGVSLHAYCLMKLMLIEES